MAQSIVKTYNAKADYSANEGYAVYLNGGVDGTLVGGVAVATICGAGAAAIGVIKEPPEGKGYAMGVTVFGDAKGVAGGDITPGARLKTHTDGTLIPVTDDKDAYIAVAQEAAAAGDLFDIFVIPGYHAA